MKFQCISKIIQLVIKYLCKSEFIRFEEALQSPKFAQMALLQQILSEHKHTERGRSLGLDQIKSPEDFPESFKVVVPYSDFDDPLFSSWIEKQLNNPKIPILCPGGVKIFEKTSGSSGPSKLIPYNQALLKSFERYLKIWTYDILTHVPKLKTFRMYLSISPSFRSEEEIKKKIGLEDDTEYFSGFSRWLVKNLLSVPLHLKDIQDPKTFLDTVCAFLAADSDLEVISIWHPSLFTVLWDHLVSRRKIIAELIEKGIIQRESLCIRVPKNTQIAALLRSESLFTPQDLWPQLKFVSAWDSAHSFSAAQSLKKLLPHALFQGKGLLATEAPMTIPLFGSSRFGFPFLTEVLFEFEDSSGISHWIDDLVDGDIYTLVISQKGGLLRYRMKDQVRVHFTTRYPTPALEFIGRSGECSDLVGEKITSLYIQNCFEALPDLHQKAEFCILPILEEYQQPHYTVLFDDGSSHSQHSSTPLDIHGYAEKWESQLNRSFHYQYARNLGQLGPVQAIRVNQLNAIMLEYYSQVRGMKLGDIKLKKLITVTDEARNLAETVKRRYQTDSYPKQM